MNNENNTPFQPNPAENNADMNGNNNSEPKANPNPNSEYTGNGNQSNHSNNPYGSWVFSERQNQPNNGYDSKYSYSSYENAQTHQQPSYPNNTQRQNSGPAYNEHYAKQEESYRWNYEDYQNPQSRQASVPKKSKKNKGLKIFGCILGGILGVGVLTLAGFGVASLVQGDKPYTPSAPQETTPPSVEAPAVEHNLTINDKPEEETEILSDGKLTIPQRAEKVKASVVGVVNYQQSSSTYSLAAGEGSGIIMSEDGYIITNAHVIEGATGLKVVLNDGQEYAAQIIGSDSKTDIAVIKVEATGLTPAEFGNSDQLQVGEQLIAVGNPTGLELGGTLTVGYVSALDRQIDDSGINYVQTDAAINPGNSGGALANEYGQVIGINSAKIAGTDIEGLGFAISINDAQPIIDDLLNYGYVKGRVRLGITGYEMDQFMAAMNNAPTGFIVASVEANTPVAASGLIPGDVITAIDGVKVSELESITDSLEGKKPGDVVELSVFRRTQGFPDKELTIKVELIESVEKAALLQNNYMTPSQGNNDSGSYNGYSNSNPFSYFGIQ